MLEREINFLGYKVKKFKKSKKLIFFQRVQFFQWFSSEIGYLFHVFILGSIGQENVFYDILERKNAFTGYKTRSSKGRKFMVKWFYAKCD